jgi:hypothetical protein
MLKDTHGKIEETMKVEIQILSFIWVLDSLEIF